MAMAESFEPTRRQVLTRSTAAVLGMGLNALLAGRVSAADQVTPLKAAARRAGLRYGSDSDTTITSAPQPYRTLFAEQCDLYAANLGWGSMAPTPDAIEPV